MRFAGSRVLTAVLALTASAALLSGQETAAQEQEDTRPPLPPPKSEITAPVAGERAAPPDLGRSSADAGALKDMKILRLEEGRAQVVLQGVERTLRPGDVVGFDTVRRVEPERIVLLRADPEKGEATVVVSQDEAGRVRVRVYWTKANLTAPPPVK